MVSNGGSDVSIGGSAGIVESIDGSDASMAGRDVSWSGKVLSIGGSETSMGGCDCSSVCACEGSVETLSPGSTAASAAGWGCSPGGRVCSVVSAINFPSAPFRYLKNERAGFSTRY